MKKVIFMAAITIAVILSANGAEAALGPNLISNPSLEAASGALPAGWNTGRWGTNTANFSYLNSGQNGSRSVRVDMASRTSGDAKWYFNDVPVSAGKNYYFADFSQSDVTTVITVQFQMSNGTFSYQDLSFVGPSSGWQKNEAGFVVPSGAVTATVFHLINSIGQLTTDSFELREVIPDAADPSNKIGNPNFETAANSNTPQGWARGRWGNNAATFRYPVAGNGGNAAEVQLSAYVSGDAKWYFNDVNVSAGEIYTFSDSYKSDVFSYITARYRLNNGNYVYEDLGQAPASASWKAFTTDFKIPPGVVAVTIFHLIKQNGTLTVDNYSMALSSGGGTPPIDPTKFSEGIVTLTFDDGWLSTYQNAIPILNAAGLKSSQAIITERLSANFPGYVKINQVLEMQSQGHEINSHTKTHRNLTLLSTGEATDEVAGSKSLLENLGVSSIKTLVYPFGAYNDFVKQISANAGYTGARSTDGGFNMKNDNDFYALKRMSVENTTIPAQAISWINQAVNDKSWLILAFHNVDYTGTRYSTTPERLQEIVNYLVANNVRVVTLKDGVSLMRN